MENGLTKFEKEFEGMEVDIIQGENGEPLFELYSTGAALGQIKISKGKTYPRRERIDQNIKDADVEPVVRGGQLYLTEEMLYDFMFEAKTDKCKLFRKWVTSDVLPSIRRTGGYVAPGLAGKDGYLLDLAKSMQLTNTVVSGMLSSITRMEEFVKDSLNSKDIQIDRASDLIGIRAKNTKDLTTALKEKLESITGRTISATSEIYKKTKLIVFKYAKVSKWEEISVGDFNRVFAYIDTIDEV